LGKHEDQQEVSASDRCSSRFDVCDDCVSSGGCAAAQALLVYKSLDGYVVIAEGLSGNAPNDPALENFHDKVHTGEPGKHLKITRIDICRLSARRRFPVLSYRGADGSGLTYPERVGAREKVILLSWRAGRKDAGGSQKCTR
jgi:hypothetical protein